MAQSYQKFQDSETSQNYVIGEAYHYPDQPQQNSTQKAQQFNYPPQIAQNQNIQPIPVQQIQTNPQQQMVYPQIVMPNQMVNPLPVGANMNQPFQPQQFMQVQPMQNFIVQNQPRTRFTEQLYCVSCKSYVPTSINYKPGLGAVLVGGLIALFGGWLGCCLIPCCVQDCQDAIHTCPKCGREIGSRQFLTN